MVAGRCAQRGRSANRPFTDPRSTHMSSVLDRDALEQSPLADLHLIANELGVDGFRRLRKADLVDAILDKQDGADAGPVEEADAEADAVEEVEAEVPRPRRARSRARSADPEVETEEEVEDEEGATDEDA